MPANSKTAKFVCPNDECKKECTGVLGFLTHMRHAHKEKAITKDDVWQYAKGGSKDGKVPCPKCDDGPFTPHGLTIHLARAHGTKGIKRARKAAKKAAKRAAVTAAVVKRVNLVEPPKQENRFPDDLKFCPCCGVPFDKAFRNLQEVNFCYRCGFEIRLFIKAIDVISGISNRHHKHQ
jgi:hypothetical protein